MDDRLSALKKDIQRFEEIVNTSGEFHKTKEYPPWEWITDREQLKQIVSLSRENHEVTSALSSSLDEFSGCSYGIHNRRCHKGEAHCRCGHCAERSRLVI